MRTLRFFSILVSGILLSLAHALAVDKIDGFAKLTSTDTLQMRFTSGGCFHFYTCELTFTRTPKPTVSVVAVRLESPDPRGRYRDAERRDLGKLPLSEKDLAGLDTLLGFYRTNNSGGCTTVDSIKISQIRDGKVMATENFTDASCRASGGKGVLSIESLVRRLPEKKEKQ